MTKSIENLKKSGLKITPQRVAIVEFLSEYGHLSISKMYELVKEKFPSISLATIYKNVNAMIDNGFLKEVKIIGQDSRYELNYGEHSHVVCKECGKVVDIDIDTQTLFKEAEEKSTIKVESSSMVFYGICGECAKGHL